MCAEFVACLLDERASGQSISLMIRYLFRLLERDCYRIFPIGRRRTRAKNNIPVPPLPEFKQFDRKRCIGKRWPAFERRRLTRINPEVYQLVLVEQVSFGIIVMKRWEPFAAPQPNIGTGSQELLDLCR